MTPKIFGIGLNKTGTKTLGACFDILGFNAISCRADLLAYYRAGQLDRVFAVIDQFEAFEDWPYPLMYRELFARYGHNARFILTRRRDPATWLASLKKHSLKTDPDSHCRLLAYGYPYPHGVEPHHLDFYDRHLREVRAFFRSQNAQDQLLEACWEEATGWHELCAFLAKPIPAQPFPYLNKSEDFPTAQEKFARNQELIKLQIGLLNPSLLIAQSGK